MVVKTEKIIGLLKILGDLNGEKMDISELLEVMENVESILKLLQQF